MQKKIIQSLYCVSFSNKVKKFLNRASDDLSYGIYQSGKAQTKTRGVKSKYTEGYQQLPGGLPR